MSLSITYVCSQILVIIYYLIYASTFNLKDKSKILKIGILATIMSALSYLLLGAYTGVAMCVISIIRNIWFNKSKSKNSLIIVFYHYVNNKYNKLSRCFFAIKYYCNYDLYICIMAKEY